MMMNHPTILQIFRNTAIKVIWVELNGFSMFPREPKNIICVSPKSQIYGKICSVEPEESFIKTVADARNPPFRKFHENAREGRGSGEKDRKILDVSHVSKKSVRRIVFKDDRQRHDESDRIIEAQN